MIDLNNTICYKLNKNNINIKKLFIIHPSNYFINFILDYTLVAGLILP